MEDNNKEHLENEIRRKNSTSPYYTNYSYYNIHSDHDEFPYRKSFKSVVKSDKATVDNRDAGWMPRKYNKNPNVYKDKSLSSILCFQNPCSTVYPCYNQDNSYYMSNKVCITKTI
jgi:hypothetical protein